MGIKGRLERKAKEGRLEGEGKKRGRGEIVMTLGENKSKRKMGLSGWVLFLVQL